MNASPSPFIAELDAALHWWRMAGVDCGFLDDATDWLAEPRSAPAPQDRAGSQKTRASETPQNTPLREEKPVEIPVAKPDLFAGSPPDDLEGFRRWWLEAPGLDDIGPRGRVPPRGPHGAPLMVIVIDPEQADRDALLSGAQGRLLSNILSAMGIAPDGVYLASALPRHTPMADTGAIAARGMAEVTARHIALAAPQRVLAFGSDILPLLGHELTTNIQSLREINQDSRSMPLMVSEGLQSMLDMPRLKARFWRRWIEWSPPK